MHSLLLDSIFSYFLQIRPFLTSSIKHPQFYPVKYSSNFAIWKAELSEEKKATTNSVSEIRDSLETSNAEFLLDQLLCFSNHLIS